MAGTHHTMVTDTAVGEYMAPPMRTMAGHATMAAGTAVGVTTQKMEESRHGH